MASALQLLGHRPTFLSALGRDKLARFALAELTELGFEAGQLKLARPGGGQSSCFALVLMDSLDGQCECVLANLDAVQAIDAQAIETSRRLIERAPLLVLDANLSTPALSQLLAIARGAGRPVFLEPTDVLATPHLVELLLQTGGHSDALLAMSPNLVELRELVAQLGWPHASALEPGCPLQDIELAATWLLQSHLPRLACLLVTLDTRGVLILLRSGALELMNARLMRDHPLQSPDVPLRSKHLPAPILQDKPRSASGAGDCFAAGFVSGLLRDLSLAGCTDLAFQAAQLALQDPNPIPVTLAKLASRGSTRSAN